MGARRKQWENNVIVASVFSISLANLPVGKRKGSVDLFQHFPRRL
jgi:hypothetical protein